MATARILGSFALVLGSIIVWAGCDKKPTKTDTGAINALDRTGSPVAVDTTPLPNLDISKLEADKQQLFYKLIASFKSPCGKSESLRASYVNDQTCRRAPFAARFVVAMLEDEATEEVLREVYAEQYENPTVSKIDVSGAPSTGPNDAGVRMVEFFDYACSHCRDFKPVLDQVLEAYAGKVSMHYMMYPVPVSTYSRPAAQAALAAHAQGKFDEMHKQLFAVGSKDAVMGLAASLGLDLAKFTADYEAAGAKVDAHYEKGKAAKIRGTPGLFINGRLYSGPQTVKYLSMAIDEEVAVNR